MRGGCRLCFTEVCTRSGCEIGDAGAAALAGALEKNTVLQKLALSCKIGDAGISASIASFLARNIEVLFFLLIFFAVVHLVCFFVCAHSIFSDCS